MVGFAKSSFDLMFQMQSSKNRDMIKRSEFMFQVNEEERRGLSLLLSNQEGSQS